MYQPKLFFRSQIDPNKLDEINSFQNNESNQ